MDCTDALSNASLIQHNSNVIYHINKDDDKNKWLFISTSTVSSYAILV